jgi:hypothetical protein
MTIVQVQHRVKSPPKTPPPPIILKGTYRFAPLILPPLSDTPQSTLLDDLLASLFKQLPSFINEVPRSQTQDNRVVLPSSALLVLKFLPSLLYDFGNSIRDGGLKGFIAVIGRV